MSVYISTVLLALIIKITLYFAVLKKNHYTFFSGNFSFCLEIIYIFLLRSSWWKTDRNATVGNG